MKKSVLMILLALTMNAMADDGQGCCGGGPGPFSLEKAKAAYDQGRAPVAKELFGAPKRYMKIWNSVGMVWANNPSIPYEITQPSSLYPTEGKYDPSGIMNTDGSASTVLVMKEDDTIAPYEKSGVSVTINNMGNAYADQGPYPVTFSVDQKAACIGTYAYSTSTIHEEKRDLFFTYSCRIAKPTKAAPHDLICEVRLQDRYVVAYAAFRDLDINQSI